jgi:hypothetical protein
MTQHQSALSTVTLHHCQCPVRIIETRCVSSVLQQVFQFQSRALELLALTVPSALWFLLSFFPYSKKKTGSIDLSSTEQFHSSKTREHFLRYPVVVNRHLEGFTWLCLIGNAWTCWHYLISNKTRIWLICTWRQHKSGRCLQAINSWFSEKALKTLSMRTERSTLMMIMQCLRTVFGKRIHSTSEVWREGEGFSVCFMNKSYPPVITVFGFSYKSLLTIRK